MEFKNVTMRCDDNAEALVFTRYTYSDLDTSYEVTIEDSYCLGSYSGLFGRFKRAWCAFWGKPIYYSGVYTDDKNRIRSWLTDCLAVLDTEEDSDNI